MADCTKVLAALSVAVNPMETVLELLFKPVGMSVASKTRCINYTTPTNGLIFSTICPKDYTPSSIHLYTTTPIGFHPYM
jgi:hypothetical protein